ncbi:CGGC domain-containing protein [Clostridium fallax]|uniref:Predicted metal-binding protein n=1 Tax=Clostridium fallax TaxID=1533 RepID=A0A1M4VYN6_9CLOT|nr:CGGC domain-containing protein [Clostridium fallax]SHE74076.1 Predicted metal-binding protein [Clostridium fallax]SQB07759.1 CGGC domain-containing protein [Clostridium fallax]
MKIAIVICEKLSYECSAIGCFNAFNKKEKAFEIYKNDNIELFGLFHCNGCNSDLNKDLDYKITQLKKFNVEIIHLAKCIEVECFRYCEIKRFFENKGFKVIEGTH